MRFSAALALAGLAYRAVAEDLLFIDTLQFEEYNEATGKLGMTAKVVTDAEWRAMSTSDFAKFKAIIIGDSASSDQGLIQFLDDTKSTWSPAVRGNMILIGTDPSNHFGAGEPGAGILIDNAVQFAASGKDNSGASATGFYFALAHYFDTLDTGTLNCLSKFGEFDMRGNLDCYDIAHIVASSPALGTLDDAALSNWGCSVHEAFSKYPSTGINGFQALAIAKDIIGDGSQTFGDGTVGLPYIISRGATPAGCGDGKFDPTLGEECDDGNVANGDGCSGSCKCESGRPKGDGTCLPPLGSNSTTSVEPNTPTGTAPAGTAPVSGTAPGTASAGPYGNASTVYPGGVTPPYPITTTTTFTAPPYITPGYPQGPKIIGVEIIIDVTIIESCSTVNPTSTITSYITSACSTMNKPIFDTSMSQYPCYVCAGVTCPAGSFLTVTTTICKSCSGGTLPTPVLPVYQTCNHCSGLTMTETAVWQYTPPAGSDYCVPAPTPVPHSEHAVNTASPSYPANCPTCTMSTVITLAPTATVPTGTVYPKPTSSTAAEFTGGAAGNNVEMFSIIAGVLLAIPMLL
ncbi:MAG: hypothetical protein M1840_002041 [Geoglossum simile]|nr:MAG: hypothetical protein M1840_002041 [Geoglossum simile]